MSFQQRPHLELLNAVLPLVSNAFVAEAEPTVTGTATTEVFEDAPDATFLDAPQHYANPEPIPESDLKRPRSARFTALQSWAGSVVEVGESTFKAYLTPWEPGHERAVAEFSIDDLSPSDQTLLATGRGVYWAVGYLTLKSGTRVRSHR
jgi:hypothetical protein